MKLVYADYNATVPCTNEHNKKVLNLLLSKSANPSSIHRLGRETKLLVEESREKVAAIFGAPRNHIYFTSGATESNNFVIQGHVFEKLFSGKKAKLLISNAEHSSVYQPADYLHKKGLCELSFIPVHTNGFVDKETLLKHLDKDTSLVCLIHVNNEIGSITDVLELAQCIKDKVPEALVHIDAVQSYGKLDLRKFHASRIDTASASAHKIGGFKGIGCFYMKKGVNLSPLIIGGGQERAWRAGTENLPGIISFGIRAGELLEHKFVQHTETLSRAFVKGLLEIPGVHLHGDLQSCLPTTVNFHIDRVGGEELLLTFDTAGIYVSNGSACASGGGRPSRVLKAMGYDDIVSTNSVRVSFGEASSLQDVDYILKTLRHLVVSKK